MKTRKRRPLSLKPARLKRGKAKQAVKPGPRLKKAPLRQATTSEKALNRKLAAENAQLRKETKRLGAAVNDLSNLLNNTEIAILVLDTHLRVHRFTPAVNDLLELPASAMGQPLTKLKRKFTDRNLMTDLRGVLKEKHPIEAEVVSASGRAYVRRALPYRNSKGGIDGVLLTFLDITRLKLAETALRSSEERHRLILDGVAEYAILILDQDGRFMTWSTSAERILGYHQAETIGQPLDIIYTDEDRSAGTMQKELQQARERKSITEERWHLRKDRTRFWGTGVFSALFDEDNNLYGFVKVLRDNTDRKFVEETLHKAKTDAENANAAKDHFLANISHELRTPLSATLLWAKLLGAQPSISAAQLKEGLDAIEKSAKEQQALIEDLVDTSRMVAGKLRLQLKEVEFPSLARSVLEILRSTAAEKGITIEESIDPHTGIVRADPLRLKQILSNLLTNSVKFTPPGGRVSLVAERQGDQIEIRVSDTGQGIAKEFLSRVFDRFTQADPSGVRHTGGLGLGLSIARQLVEMHGGTISVHSPGLAKGAVFTVRLPFAEILPSAAPSPSPMRKMPSLAGLNILLVEDVEDTRKALLAVLVEAGAKVIATDSAQHALEEFNRMRPELILSDIGLGNVSGHELIQQIRQWEKARKTAPCPALALTAYADEKNRSLALESGFQEILIKPIEPVVLLSSLLSLHAMR